MFGSPTGSGGEAVGQRDRRLQPDLPDRGGLRPQVDAQCPAEFGGQDAGRRRAVLGELGQAAPDHRLDGRRHVRGPDLGEPGRRAVDVGVGQGVQVGVRERQPAGQHLEQDHPGRVQVGPAVDRVPAELVGGHVRRRPPGDDHPGPGQPRRRQAGPAGQVGQPEVHDLEVLVWGAGVDHHQVGRLQVPVDDPAGVGRLQGVAQAPGQPGGPVQPDPPDLLEELFEGGAGDELQDHARAGVVVHPGVQDADDVRVPQAGGVPRLPLEELPGPRAVVPVGPHHLDDDGRGRVVGRPAGVGLPRAAHAQHAQGLVLAEEVQAHE